MKLLRSVKLVRAIELSLASRGSWALFLFSECGPEITEPVPASSCRQRFAFFVIMLSFWEGRGEPIARY